MAIMKCIQARYNVMLDEPIENPAQLYTAAVIFILGAMVCDSLDGRVARLGGRESLFREGIRLYRRYGFLRASSSSHGALPDPQPRRESFLQKHRRIPQLSSTSFALAFVSLDSM